MNRIWVRLWLGIVASGIGSFLCFTLSALLILLFFGDNPTADTEAALIIVIVGFGGTILLSIIVAAWIARRLARPIAAVSEAARRVAGGDLRARATPQDPLRQLRRKWTGAHKLQRQRAKRRQARQKRILRARSRPGKNPGSLGPTSKRQGRLRRKWMVRERRRRALLLRRRARSKPRTLGPLSKRQGRRRRVWMTKQRRNRRKGKTEAQRLLEDFNIMAASLERLETERQATTAAIAHDLRTPLTILWGRLAGARDGLISLDKAEVELLLGQTELLARMVEDLRTLSLAEAGKLSLRRSTVDASDLVERVVMGYVSQAADKGVTLGASIAPEIRLEADPDRIQQILVNLLDNALRFAPAGGRVWISLKAVKRSATLSVRDDGPGIGEEALKHVFKRFYREDTARSGAGTGLGLAIVHSLVSLHGGSVSASNHPSGGALFEVTLPRSTS